MSDEAVRKEFHPDAVEIIKFLRDVVSVNMADSDWKQAERFIDAAVNASRAAAIQECADFISKFGRDKIDPAVAAKKLLCETLPAALLALKER